MVTVAAERERGVPGPAGAGHLAVHTRVVRKLAQPLRGRIGVGGQDLLDGKHIGAEGPDHPGDHLVVLSGLRRVAGEQVEQVV